MKVLLITKNFAVIRVVAGLILVFSAFPAQAYLDPGTGSLIIQSVIGALAAIGVTLKLYWHKIKLKFSGRKPSESRVNLQDNSSPED